MHSPVSDARLARGLLGRRRLPSLAGAAAALALLTVLLDASTPRFFRAATPAEFLRGDLQQLALDSRGQLRLGPAMPLLHEAPTPFIWSVMEGSGGAVLLGTGSEGRVFRVDAQGNATILFDAPELEVHALAPAPGGGVYVATSPDGRIYKVDAKGASTVFYEPGERYIWALATDRSGTLFAATGEPAAVFRIAPDGTGRRVFQPQATHATELLFDAEGRLLIGTEAPGRVIRMEPDGRGFVLLDSAHTEIGAMIMDRSGNVYVAAVSGGAPGPPPTPAPDTSSTSAGGDNSGRTPVATVTTEVTYAVDTSGTDAAASAQGGARQTRGTIYRIAPDGLWDQLWESREDTPYDLSFDAAGRLLIGTGPQGRLFRLEGDPLQPTLLARASAQQVTVVHSRPGGDLYVATANPGKLFRLGSARAPEGTYQSEVLDAQVAARWGAISWRGSTPPGSRIEVRTRSGNTPTPDAGWSEWSAPYTDSAGTPIASPNARYLQWRVLLAGSGEGPVLTSITAAYLQRNLRPRVHSLTVHPPGIVFERPFTSGEPDLAGFGSQSTPERQLAIEASNQSGGSTLGRRTYRRGLQTLIWRADDENGDDLTYTLHYRREGDADWTLLREALEDSIFVWNTATVPDGTYFVRISASDRPSNAAESALIGDLVSQAFEVDNTPPEVAVQSVRVADGNAVVTVQVTDSHSIVQRLEYSRDGLTWQSAFPVDGIADSRTERFEVAAAGVNGRGLSLRAIDAMNNTSAAYAAAPQGGR